MPELHAPKRRKKPENDYRYPVPTVKNNSKQEAQKNIKPIRTEKPVKPIKPVKPANTANSNRRRKQNMVIYYMMFLLTGIVIFSILSVTVLFKLEKIQTEGDCIYSEEEILAAANVKTSVNLLRFDTEECKKRIIDSLVYIDSVQIRKSLPDKIVIQINGASEMADIEYMGSFYTVSENGRILKQTERYNHKNTVIHGFEAEEVVVGGYIKSTEDRKTELLYTLMQTAGKAELSGITDIDISDYMDIRMIYNGKIELHIGTEAELELKFRAAAGLIETESGNWSDKGTLRLVDPSRAVFQPAEMFEEVVLPIAPEAILAEIPEE